MKEDSDDETEYYCTAESSPHGPTTRTFTPTTVIQRTVPQGPDLASSSPWPLPNHSPPTIRSLWPKFGPYEPSYHTAATTTGSSASDGNIRDGSRSPPLQNSPSRSSSAGSQSTVIHITGCTVNTIYGHGISNESEQRRCSLPGHATSQTPAENSLPLDQWQSRNHPNPRIPVAASN